MRLDERADADEQVLERRDVRLGRAAVAVEEREGLQGADHRTRIALLCGTSAQVPSARIVETGHGHRLRVDRILHLPGVAGPRIAGLPCDPDGFIPVGADLHVDDDPDVLAIGDGAVGAYKHGGLAALQADAVAQELAARAGALLAPQPYRPALQAVLATNDGPRYLRAEPPGGAGESVVSAECLWWPPTKVASHWLAPWLADAPRRAR